MEKLANQPPVYVSRMTADKCRLQLGFRSFYRTGLSPITEQTKRRVCLFANLFSRVSSCQACNLTRGTRERIRADLLLRQLLLILFRLDQFHSNRIRSNGGRNESLALFN